MQVRDLLSAHSSWLSDTCITRIFEVVNKYQIERGASLYCVPSLLTSSLFLAASSDNSGRFARILFQSIVGERGRVSFPRALVLAMHVDKTHYITLLLLAALRKIYVYDSLTTSVQTKRAIQKLASAFHIENIKYRPTVQQSERPCKHCGVFVLGFSIGMCFDVEPVSDLTPFILS